MPRRKTFIGPIHPETPRQMSVKLDPVAELAYWWLKPESPDHLSDLSGDLGNQSPELGEAARVGLILAALAYGCRREELLEVVEQHPLVECIRRVLYPDDQEILESERGGE